MVQPHTQALTETIRLLPDYPRQLAAAAEEDGQAARVTQAQLVVQAEAEGQIQEALVAALAGLEHLVKVMVVEQDLMIPL